ncbi:hypothetical protein EC930624_2372 [Escherichia coli 93.0624]|nr:hypothetical protein EC930624_2372 [Escherichia coli 93.0624]
MSNPNPCMTCGACCAFFASLFTGLKQMMLAKGLSENRSAFLHTTCPQFYIIPTRNLL